LQGLIKSIARQNVCRVARISFGRYPSGPSLLPKSIPLGSACPLGYRPYWFDRISAGLDDQGRPVAWNNRFAGSSVIARWLPPAFKDGLDPDSTEGAIDLVYDLPNFHVEYVRVEPPGIPTAFWRSVGPSHNVFVTESFIDEMAVAAKQDAVAYRRALLGKSPRAKAVLDLAAEKAGWGQVCVPKTQTRT
jgi:isoquinoline 1-oxidoreductase subunit beta